MYYPHDDFNNEGNTSRETPVETTYRNVDMEQPPRKKRGWTKIVALCLVCALLGGVAGVGGAALYQSQSQGSTSPLR